MDERLEKAIDHANYAITIQTQKKNLKLRFQNALTHSVHGGTFTVEGALISFVDVLLRRTPEDENGKKAVVLIDDRGNPISIPDLEEFMSRVVEIYHEAANEYAAGFAQLRKSRTVKASVGL